MAGAWLALACFAAYAGFMYWLSEVAAKDMERRGKPGRIFGYLMASHYIFWLTPIGVLAWLAARRRYPILETKKGRNAQERSEAGDSSSQQASAPEDSLRELERKTVNSFDRLRGLEARAAREVPRLSPAGRADLEEALAVLRTEVDGYLRLYLNDARPRGFQASHLDELVILRQRAGADLPVSSGREDPL